MTRIIKIIFISVAILLIASAGAQAQIFGGLNGEDVTDVQAGTDLTKESLKGAGITHTDTLGDLIIKYVNFILPYLTLAAFVGLVIAGFFYITAYGNEEQLGKAKKILIWSAVGLILVMASYTIIQLLTSGLIESL